MKKINSILFLLLVTIFIGTPTFSNQKEFLQKKETNILKTKKKKPEKNLANEQKMASNFLGCWGNAFGSVMTIETHNLDTGEFFGKYSSTTGSSGTFFIHGYTQPDPSGNYPITMTIAWNNIETGGNSKDPSQYWTSIMTGIYNSSSKSLKLMNVISSAIEFPEVQIFEPGNYPETLEYTKKSDSDCAFISKKKLWNGDADPSVYQTLSDALAINKSTTWIDKSGLSDSMTIQFDQITQANAPKEFAKITGQVTIDGKAHQLVGECSYLTPENKSALSMAITYSDSNGSYTMGLTGILDASKGTLDLLESRSQECSIKNIYAANTVKSRIYVTQK